MDTTHKRHAPALLVNLDERLVQPLELRHDATTQGFIRRVKLLWRDEREDPVEEPVAGALRPQVRSAAGRGRGRDGLDD
mgnify:CR=1 FL=1